MHKKVLRYMQKRPSFRDGRKHLSRPVSRVLSRVTIYLFLPLPAGSSDYMGADEQPLCSAVNLASDGVYRLPASPWEAVSSYLAFPPLPGKSPAVSFCCTFLGVASTGRYPASRSVKLGLSSYFHRSHSACSSAIRYKRSFRSSHIRNSRFFGRLKR